MFRLLEFPDRDLAARYASHKLATSLRTHLAKRIPALMIVSGGSSPIATLEHLAGEKLAWCNVNVMLSDERCVPVSDANSNQRMVREKLIDPSAARFVDLFDETPGDFSGPVACALLGMGEDGHFASLFRDFDGIDRALDLSTRATSVRVCTASSPYRRVSATLSFLVRAQIIILLIFGEKKKSLVGSCAGLPVESLLKQKLAPVEVVWAP